MKRTIQQLWAAVFALMVMWAMGCNPTTQQGTNPPKPASAFTDSISAAEQAALPPIVSKLGPEVMRSRFAKANMDAFKARPGSAGPAIVSLNLFPNFQPSLVADSVVPTKDGFDIWHLRLDTNKLSFATMITSDHTVFLQLQIEGHVFTVNPIQKDIVQILEVDQAKIERPEHAPGDWSGEFAFDPGPTTVSTIDPGLKVLVLATPDFHYMCAEPMYRLIYENNFNGVVNAYQPTSFHANFEFDCIQFTPSNDLHQEVLSINTNAEVVAKRDAHKADLVGILVPEGLQRGSTLGANPSGGGNPSNIFASLVVKAHALDDYTMAHELGHSMGMMHDRLFEQNNMDPQRCNFGIVFDVAYEGLGTVKARCVHADYRSCNNCPRIGTFSQPYTYHDAPITMGPMGVACAPSMGGPLPADNRSILIKNWNYVRQYR